MHPLFLPIQKAQLLSYMKLLDIPLGLIINFNVLKLSRGGRPSVERGAGSGDPRTAASIEINFTRSQFVVSQGRRPRKQR